MSETLITIDPTAPIMPTVPDLNATERRNADGCAFAFTEQIDLNKATTVLIAQTEDLDGNGAFIPSENFVDIMTAINNVLTTYNRRITFVSTPIVFAPETPDEGYQYRILTTAHVKGHTI